MRVLNKQIEARKQPLKEALIPRYKFFSKLSRLMPIGMGEVYRARDTRLGRDVAVKILPGQVSNDPVRKQRFEREAKTISSLHHPDICTLHDIGSQHGRWGFWFRLRERVIGKMGRTATAPRSIVQAVSVTHKISISVDIVDDVVPSGTYTRRLEQIQFAVV